MHGGSSVPLAEPPPHAILGSPVPSRAHRRLRAPVTDRRLHLIKEGKKRIKIKILLLFFCDKSAARNSSIVSLPGFSFVFLFHASISSSSCSCLLFFLLTLIDLTCRKLLPQSGGNLTLIIWRLALQNVPIPCPRVPGTVFLPGLGLQTCLASHSGDMALQSAGSLNLCKSGGHLKESWGGSCNDS